MKNCTVRIAAFALFCGSLLTAQPVDDTLLKQVIIFGRHRPLSRRSGRIPALPYPPPR